MLDDDKLVVVRGLSHGFSGNGAAAARSNGFSANGSAAVHSNGTAAVKAHAKHQRQRSMIRMAEERLLDDLWQCCLCWLRKALMMAA